MQLPTKRVRIIASGHEVTINASDFDPKRHTLVGEGRAPAPSPEPQPIPEPMPAAPEPFDETPGSIATVNVEVALSLIEQADSAASLDELERAEKASPKNKGGRKSVLSAIKERRAALRKG